MKINSPDIDYSVTPTVNGVALSLGTHTHDERYYTESEIQTSSISLRKPYINANGVPSSNLGSPNLAEMGLFQEQFNNKTEFYDISQISFQTSSDGSTWTDFIVSDSVKRLFVGGDAGTSISIPYGTVYFRIKVRATSYVYLNALYAYWSSNGHSTKVQIYKKHDSGTYTQHTSSTVTVGAWPGHLYLPFSTVPFNVNAVLGTHYHEIYIVFTPTWNTSYPSNNITLNKFQLWGGYPAGKRTLYGVDENKNATFPAQITGTQLISTIATGTAPLSVTSTTLCTNLNADKLDGNEASAFATASHSHAISDVTNLQTTLDAKAPLASPAFTGTPYVNITTSPSFSIGTGSSTGCVLKLRSSGTEGWLYWDDTNDKYDFKDNSGNYKPIYIGGINATGTVTLPSTTSIGNVTSTELGYLDGVTSAIQTQLSAKAPLASPVLTGTPTAPTATSGTNTTQIATTAFVQNTVTALGAGDMSRAVYDKNLNGIVDNAEKVNGIKISVSTSIPASNSIGDLWIDLN